MNWTKDQADAYNKKHGSPIAPKEIQRLTKEQADGCIGGGPTGDITLAGKWSWDSHPAVPLKTDIVMRPKKWTFIAWGEPKAQPRVRACNRGKRAGVYDPGTADAWKRTVMAAAKEAWNGVPFKGPLKLKLEFYFLRPRGHFRTGKHAAEMKPTAPKCHSSKPDWDNLGKAVCDAITTTGIWGDDCQISSVTLTKRYAALQGCRIEIQTDEEKQAVEP